MFKEDEQDNHEEYQDYRCQNMPCGMPPCYSMQCPMQTPCPMPQYEAPMMNMPCPSMCGKSKKWREDEDFEPWGEDDRVYYSKPYYPPQHYNPYYPPTHFFHHHYHHYPHGPQGPWMVKRDVEE